MVAKKISILFLILSFLTLAACVRHPYYEQFHVVKKDTYCANQQIQLLQKSSGAKVFRNPETAMLMVDIPTNNIFLPHSANFTDSAYKTLDYVVNILNCYEEEDVKVTGNIMPGKNWNDKLTLALAKEQAHQVYNYLWTQNINASLTYATGKITSQNFIEITFKKYWRDKDVHFGTE